MQANHHITKSAPALTYDINKLNDAGITPSITEALTQIPPVPWHTDVHTHAALLETQILTILELYCPKDKRTARKKWLSENTTSIAQVKGRCFTTLRRYHGLWQRYLLTTTLLYWHNYTQYTLDHHSTLTHTAATLRRFVLPLAATLSKSAHTLATFTTHIQTLPHYRHTHTTRTLCNM